MIADSNKKYMTVVLELPTDDAIRATVMNTFPLFSDVAGATVVGLAHGNAIHEAELLEVVAGTGAMRPAKKFLNERQIETWVEHVARNFPPHQRTLVGIDLLRLVA